MITYEVKDIEHSGEFDLLRKHGINKIDKDLIPVIYFDNSPGMVNPAELEVLIQKRIIVSFRRSNEWVRVKGDQIRKNRSIYRGPDRRES